MYKNQGLINLLFMDPCQGYCARKLKMSHFCCKMNNCIILINEGVTIIFIPQQYPKLNQTLIKLWEKAFVVLVVMENKKFKF